MKALAALTRERSPILPDLPTAHEQGLTGFDAYTWNAVFLPKGTPPALVTKLNAALVAVMEMPAFRERLAYARPHRRGAGAPDARLSGKLRRKRNREMGGPDQGQRREGGLMSSFAAARTSRIAVRSAIFTRARAGRGTA